MTMGISRIFRSTDAGAPQFTQTAGTLKDVLKAVLVNGYGSTQSLGWTLEYEIGAISVFRSKGGTRTFLRIDDSATDPLYAKVSAFSTMSSINNGTERIPPVGIDAYLWKCTTNGNTPWYIIGDDAGFWLLHQPFYNVGGSLIKYIFHVTYFGDYNSYNVANKWNYLFSPSNGIYTTSSGLIPRVASSPYYIGRGGDFAKGCVTCGALSMNPSATYFGQAILSTRSLGENKLNGVYLGSPIRLYETISGVGNIIIGTMPGILEPLCTSTALTFVASDLIPVETVDADGGLSIFLYGNYTSNSTSKSTINKFILKVGKGFRNVQ